MKFITKSTKTTCIVASVLTGLALITLIMLSTLLEISSVSKTWMCFIYTVSLMLILLAWQGILQIKVFNDYESQRKYLCADGIISLSMCTLLTVSAILFGILQVDKIINGILIGTSDIRIFLTCFLAVVAFWKLAVMIVSIKEKHFNWWCEMLFTVCWITLSVLCLVSMFIPFNSINLIVWLIVAFGWTLIIVNIFYMLYSYVCLVPTYLETQEAIDIKQEELDEIKRQKEKDLYIATSKNSNVKQTAIQDKLKKLKDLKELGLITEDDYEVKKAEILSKF